MDFKFKKPVIFGFGGGFLLLGFYFLFPTLANSFSHAVSQFLQTWYWILILVAGFGTQVGLYTFIREKLKTAPTKVLATSGGISTGSMIVCCLHHFIDVLPIMGLAAASLFLIKYQILFLVIGILANLIGIIIMLEIIQKNNLPQYSFLKRILVYDMSRMKKIAIGFSLILTTFFLVNKLGGTSNVINLPSKINNQVGITFKVTPVDFSFTNPVKLEIEIDTHSGSLDFDLTKISILKDNNGNQYKSIDWQGSPPGSHHLAGILTFPKVSDEAEKIKLIIKDVSERIFEWELN